MTAHPTAAWSAYPIGPTTSVVEFWIGPPPTMQQPTPVQHTHPVQYTLPRATSRATHMPPCNTETPLPAQHTPLHEPSSLDWAPLPGRFEVGFYQS